MLVFTLVGLLSTLAVSRAGFLNAAVSPYAFPPAPLAFPPAASIAFPPVAPIAFPPASVALSPAPVALSPAPILPSYGLLPYTPAPFGSFGYPTPIIKSSLGFGYSAPILKSHLPFGYSAPVIKSVGHFDYHETPIIKAAPLSHYHVKSYAPSFGYPHAHIFA